MSGPRIMPAGHRRHNHAPQTARVRARRLRRSTPTRQAGAADGSDRSSSTGGGGRATGDLGARRPAMSYNEAMRKIVVSEFISLDGVVQAPGGAQEDLDGGFRHGGWSMPYFDPEVMGAAIGEASADTGAILQGRRTWQVMAGAWPERAGDEFADFMNTVQKYVVSDTLEDADVQHWSPTTIIRGAELVTEIQKLRDTPGGSVSVMG